MPECSVKSHFLCFQSVIAIYNIHIYEYLLVYKSSVFTVYMWRVFTIFELNTSISIDAVDAALNRLERQSTFTIEILKNLVLEILSFFFDHSNFYLLFFLYKTVINLYVPHFIPGLLDWSLHSIECSM